MLSCRVLDFNAECHGMYILRADYPVISKKKILHPISGPAKHLPHLSSVHLDMQLNLTVIIVQIAFLNRL